MAKIHNEITINAPVEKVWATLADLEQVQYYNPAIAKARYISTNKEGAGAARHCDFKDGKWVKERVTAVTPHKSMSIEMYEHQWPVKYMRWRTNLAPEGSGTHVSQKLEYEVKFGILGKLLDSLMMRGKMSKMLNEIFESMKRYIESREASGK